jgi:hypothetical protein
LSRRGEAAAEKASGFAIGHRLRNEGRNWPPGTARQHHPEPAHAARNGISAAVATSSKVKSSKMSKDDDNTPPESLTLRLKKAETAVEVATTSLKSIRTLVERQGGDVANQAQQSHSDHLLEDLKKLNKQQAAVRKMLDKP